MSERREEPPFFLKGRHQMQKLETWLKERRFNCGGQFGEDRKGNPMVSIGWDSAPDNDWKLPDKRGLIIVIQRDLLPDVEAMIERMKAS